MVIIKKPIKVRPTCCGSCAGSGCAGGVDQGLTY